jgi:cold shock CspA family protein
MNVPVELTFRDVPKTDAIEALVLRHASSLERFCDHVSSCRIAIERPQCHQRAGNPYRVRIDVTVPPGHELVVSQDPLDNDLHADLTTVINHAFKAMRRRLQRLVDAQRGDVKPRSEPRAIVVRLFRDQDYGFLKSPEGRELYFHRHSVLHDAFDELDVGTEVRFAEAEGEGVMGPQASSVQVVAKPGAHRSHDDLEAAAPPLGWEA